MKKIDTLILDLRDWLSSLKDRFKKTKEKQ